MNSITIFAVMEKQSTNKAIENFLLRINKDVKEMANKEAKKENRSLNGHIVTLVEADLKSKGLL